MKSLASSLVGLGAAVLLVAGTYAPASATGCGTACGQQRNTCLAAAKMQYRAAQMVCGSDHASCRESCGNPSVPPPDPSCLGACGRQLGACSRTAAAAVTECIRTCKAGDAGAAACHEGCAQLAADQPGVCKDEHASCLEACRPE
jgi:hypothetical protein